MSHALRRQAARPASARSIFGQFFVDLRVGAATALRSMLLLAGVAALALALLVLLHGDLRARVATDLPSWLAGLRAESGALPAADPDGAAAAAAAVLQAVPLDAAAMAQQTQIAQYLSRRYRVAGEAVRGLVATAYRTGHELQLDPKLILAVMAIESSMNPLAESPVGAQGLMQVMTSIHLERFAALGGQRAALEPEANIRVGAAILKELIERGGTVERGLQLYVGAGNQPDDGGYSARVLGERARIALAATGQVGAALAAAAASVGVGVVQTVGGASPGAGHGQPISL